MEPEDFTMWWAFHQEGRTFAENAEANARLIAAAPELLAACEAMTIRLSLPKDHPMVLAIRRARGEE